MCIFITCLMITLHCINFLEIAISGDYSDLQVGRTQNITCTVPGIPPDAVMWSGTWSRASLSSDVLMLSSIDSTLNGTEFTCSVNSSVLYSGSPNMKKIIVTVKSMSTKFNFVFLLSPYSLRYECYISLH